MQIIQHLEVDVHQGHVTKIQTPVVCFQKKPIGLKMAEYQHLENSKKRRRTQTKLMGGGGQYGQRFRDQRTL